MKRYIFVVIAIIYSLFTQAVPPFSQSDINALDQEQISCFGQKIFNQTTMKAVLMHATNNDLELYSRNYTPNVGYNPNLNYAKIFMRNVHSEFDHIIKEITLHDGETLTYIFPKNNRYSSKVSILWDNPQGDVEFGYNAISKTLEDDIDLRVYGLGYQTPNEPFIFPGRINCAIGDNTTDNMEQVFIPSDVGTGENDLRLSRDLDQTIIVKISHKNKLKNGTKNISIIISGVLKEVDEYDIVNGLDFENKCFFVRNYINSYGGVGYSGVIFVAGKSIVFQPGFTVKGSNGTFKAMINSLLIPNNYVNIENRLAISRNVQNVISIENVSNDIERMSLSNKSVVFIQYYNLLGAKVDASATGIVIEKTIYTDGSVSSQKVLKK